MAELLVEGRDYTLDTARRFVLTREFLLARGQCCGSGCRNCPYPTPPGKNPETGTNLAGPLRFDGRKVKR